MNKRSVAYFSLSCCLRCSFSFSLCSLESFSLLGAKVLVSRTLGCLGSYRRSRRLRSLTVSRSYRRSRGLGLLAVLGSYRRCRRLRLLAVFDSYRRSRRLGLLAVFDSYRRNGRLRLLAFSLSEVEVYINVLNVIDLLLELVCYEVKVVDVDKTAEVIEEICYIDYIGVNGLSGLLSLFAVLSYGSLGLLVCIEVNVNLLDVVPVLDDIVCEDIDLVSVDEVTDLIEEICYIDNDGLSGLFSLFAFNRSGGLRELAVLGSYGRCRGLGLLAVFFSGSRCLSIYSFSVVGNFLNSFCCFLSCNCYSCLFCFLVCSKCVKSCYR